MSSNLSKHILATITYYDVMDYPMTSFEIWKHLTIISGEEEEKYSLADVINELESDPVKSAVDHGARKLQCFIKEEKGFYFLKDRADLVDQRIQHNKITERKYKSLLKMVSWLNFLPYIKMIGVSGRMAMKNAQDRSDFDVCIMLKQGKIFTGRALITFLMQILGLRRHGQKVRDRICLNHFITDDFFVAGKDLFSANDYTFLIPIYGFENFLKFQEKNEWIKKFKPNFSLNIKNMKKIEDDSFSRLIKFILEKALDFNIIEDSLKKWQVKKIKNNPKTSQAGSIIICEDNELAFWPNYENQGPKIFSKFKERLEKISQF